MIFFSFLQGWIRRQLSQSALPLHPLLPQLIECFVSTILPKGLKVERTNQPFEEADILAVYSDFLSGSKSAGARTDAKGEAGGRGREGENLAPQLLMLYYVLLYQDTLQSVSKSPGVWTVKRLMINTSDGGSGIVECPFSNEP